MKIAFKIIKAFFIFFSVLLIFSGLSALLISTKPAHKMPSIYGYKPLNVLGGSMEPAIKLGSVIIIKKTAADQLRKGDIVTYRPLIENNDGQNVTLTTHRINKVYKDNSGTSFETKGDANKTSDGNKITEKEIVGKVVANLPYLGTLGSLARSRNGFLLLVVLPGLVIIFTEIRNIIKQLRPIKGTSNV